MKSKIFEREGVPVNQQRVLFAGKELADDKTIDGSGIKKETILHLVLKKKEENLQQLTAFEKKEMAVAQSEKLSTFYNASAGLNDEVKIYRDSESKFDKFDNPAGEGFDLGRDGQFKDFTVVIGQWYQFDMTKPIAALRKKGFTVVHTTSEKQFLDNLAKADVAWIISGNCWQAPGSGSEFVERVYDYSRKLGGLLIFGDNDPYFVHANAVLAKMFPNTECYGSDPGGQCMKVLPPSLAIYLSKACMHEPMT